MSQKPLKLTDLQQNEVCEMLSAGATRPIAAQFAGIHPATLRAEIRRNQAFARRVIQSELKLESVMLRTIREAANDNAKQWRAAAWLLERIYPNRYAKRRTSTLTLDQVHELVSEVSEIVAAELPVPKFRQRIFDRLAVLITTVQIRPPAKPTANDSHSVHPEPVRQPLRLERHPHCDVECERNGEIPSAPQSPGESNRTAGH
jgi:hypothetical protein